MQNPSKEIFATRKHKILNPAKKIITYNLKTQNTKSRQEDSCQYLESAKSHVPLKYFAGPSLLFALAVAENIAILKKEKKIVIIRIIEIWSNSRRQITLLLGKYLDFNL